ncbi:MAG: DUF6458 family protein, partial [Actinobacteria bacterium]|nr:DUF6458 family protein [Actinomycetota bacterium]
MGFGAFLAVVGAIMRYAVHARTEGFNINEAGTILLVAGIGMILVGLIAMVIGGRGRSTVRKSVQATPTGSEQIVER